jgi:hypothetical protein
MDILGKWALAAAALASIAASPALAATPPAATPKLTNSVTCVYDAMSIEQREIAQVMLLESVTGGGNPFKDLQEDGELKALFGEAVDACIKLYAWSAGRTEASQGHALIVMVLQSAQPLFEADGVKMVDIDGYFETNKASLMASAPSKTKEAALFKHLAAKGWSFETEQVKASAGFYFFLLQARESARRWFAQSSSYRK